MMAKSHTATFPVRVYDLAATLTCGQAFRWQPADAGWIGIVGQHWVRLRAGESSLHAQAALPVSDWAWLIDYLQLEVDLGAILSTFPPDAPLRAAVDNCLGLRLLRQDPWECLASFILSSTKQIVQIRAIISLLCGRFGTPLAVPPPFPAAHAFPSAERLAETSEPALRQCKMGFRAPYLRAAAIAVARRDLDLAKLGRLPVEQARAELMKLPGVGHKIADCVLLFAYGFPSAFPLDVWVRRALSQLYFPNRPVPWKQLQHFARTHFGPNAGYAQQYLFHFMRRSSLRAGRMW